MAELFKMYWWLIFPVVALIFAGVQMILHNSYEKKKLELMKSYLDRGQPIPDALRRNTHL